MSRLWPFRRGPEHCSTCGDEFVRADYSDGYRRDGTKIVRSWMKCPRNDDYRPSIFEARQRGRCFGLSPFACANERRAYAEHRPSRWACEHHSVSDTGDACWTKDGRQITGVSS